MSRRLLFLSAVLFAAASACGWAHAATDVQRTNCGDYGSPDLAPIGAGPLELVKVFCQQVRFDFRSATVVSPDGRSIAYLEGGSSYVAERKVLHVAPLHVRNGWTDHPLNMGALWQFSSGHRTVPAFAWASNSSAIWTATREKVGPEGPAKSGLQPALAQDGSLQLLPLLRHGAGPLDGLLWADGDGLAIAHFGTRGSSYQPERFDPAQTFAIVDAKRGVVLDTLPFKAIDAYKRTGPPYIPNLNDAAVTKLRNGKVRALLSTFREWTVWTQGDAPRGLVDPYPEQSYGNRLAISPDGSRVLVGRQLVCEAGSAGIDDAQQRRTAFWNDKCKAVESDIAALHDLETGRQIWSIRATVNRASQVPAPAISDDGRYALVALPPDPPRSPIALISMNDGKIVQTLPSPGGGLDAMGFLQGGRTMWTHSFGMTVYYDVRAGGQ